MQRLLESRWLRLGFGALMALGIALYLHRNWHDVAHTARDVSPVTLVLGLATVVAGLVGSMLAYRALLTDLGSHLPVTVAARIFFVGQLGKYIPGSLWPVVAQMEMGRDAGVPRQRSASAIAMTILIYLGAGLCVGAATLPFSEAARTYRWVALAGVLVVVALHPRVLNPGIALLLRLARRPALERPVSGMAIAKAFGWSLVSWTLFGIHIDLIARDLGANAASLLPVAIGGFALAWSVGFIALIAPAGAGPRELALAAILAPQVDRPGAVAVVVAGSRVLMTLGDIVTAGIAALVWRKTRHRTPDSELIDDSV